jgi:uncharacterized protein YndB with AHSA1/START domain
MTPSRFVYVTYIRTTPQKLWSALTTTDFMRQYWFGASVESDFEAGSPWRIVLKDGRVADIGEIVEAKAPERLVIAWRHQLMPDAAAEGPSRCVMELEEANGAVKLTITHALDKPVADSKLVAAVSGGWPRILSNLKSLLETGSLAVEEKAA